MPHRYDVSRRRGNASALFRDLLASAPTTSSSSKLEDNVPLFFFILFVMPLAEGSVHGRASPVYVAGFFRGDCENEGLSQPSFCYSFALNLLSFFLSDSLRQQWFIDLLGLPRAPTFTSTLPLPGPDCCGA